MSKNARVAITGLGLVCPIGDDPSAIYAALREGRGGIGPVTQFPTEHLNNKVAGEVALTAAPADRTLSLAVSAACKAWQSAGVQPGSFAPARVGLCVGASGAGLNHTSSADIYRLCFQPHAQASAIAAELGFSGPVVMFTSASVGSALAIVHAMNLLRSHRCDIVIAGGAECLSLVNHESMDSMRLSSIGPCSPFSGKPGLTPGEGGSFFVLERFDEAQERGANIRAELFHFGVTQDAYDMVGGHPSGEGLTRAFSAALHSAGLDPHDIDWIKANGTSNREQDAAETLAIKQVFPTLPPVSAPESFVGHANGAAPAITLALAVIAFENHFIPPTLNFVRPRPGCDLDYVPNEIRKSNASRVLASSIAFGGSNVALVFGRPGSAALSDSPYSNLCITGIGVVSHFGEGFANFVQGLEGNLSAKPLAHHPGSPKLTPLQRLAISASDEALKMAGLPSQHLDPCRLGVLVGLCRGSASANAQYAASLEDLQARKAIAKYVLRMGRFTVASTLAQRFQLKAYGATISAGFGAGLHALAHACIQLESSSNEDAILVVAADETGPGPESSLAEMNWLAAGHDGCYLRPYDPASTGTRLTNGAVALVVERTSFAEKRGVPIRACLSGVALNSGTRPCQLATAMREAIQRARITPQEISAAYGNGSGIWQHDQAELAAFRHVLSPDLQIHCANSRLGFAESTSGLFQVAAALHQQTGHCLITARTEGWHNAAVVLGI